VVLRSPVDNGIALSVFLRHFPRGFQVFVPSPFRGNRSQSSFVPGGFVDDDVIGESAGREGVGNVLEFVFVCSPVLDQVDPFFLHEVVEGDV